MRIVKLLTWGTWASLLRSPAFPAWLQFASVLIAIVALWADYGSRARDVFSENSRQTIELVRQYYSREDVLDDLTAWSSIKDNGEKDYYLRTKKAEIWRNLQHLTVVYSLLITCLRDNLCDPRVARDLMCLEADSDVSYVKYMRDNTDDLIPYPVDYFYNTYCADYIRMLDAAMGLETED